MITIVDYHMGNPASIRNMLKKLGIESQLSSDPECVASADKLILPGVGAFDAGMESLQRSGLIPALNQRVLEARVPTLGICLGMQLMTRASDEGRRQGLGWIAADTLRFTPTAPGVKVPHMGWNEVTAMRASPLLENLPGDSRFYFVHSYFARCDDLDDVLLTTRYDGWFHSSFNHRNIWGVQFHPEKSHRFGMQLLRNFALRC